MYTSTLRTTILLGLLLGACGHRAPTSTAPASGTAVGTHVGPTEVVRLEHHFTNAYLVIGERVVVVDTGGPGTEARILAALDERGVPRTMVSLVIVTHGHADHAGSAGALREALQVPVAMGAADRAMAQRGHNDPLHPTGGPGRRLQRFIDPEYPAFEPDLLVTAPLDLRPFGIAGRVVPTGGHTGGSLAVVLDSGDAVVGDLVRGRFAARARPTVHYFHDHESGAHAALRELLGPAAITRVHPGHGHTLAGEDVRAWLDALERPSSVHAAAP